ncbi:hypothetical protein [Brevibacillus sp. SYSU BS000544]|uniref:hypothetical protein n=1 Tax=Brevibacillus sp. SYSU BS000544 TaxID=3416443 RepID=UPI003CE59EDE
MPNVKRGRSQVLFNYLPGSVFMEKGRWFIVKDLRLRALNESTDHLLKSAQKFIEDWSINHELNYSLFPNREDMWFVGEIEEVNCELFPLVFYCNNSSCGNTHIYMDTDKLIKQNPQMKCEFCNKGKIHQYPYALIHANGDLQPINVKLNDGQTWKDRLDGIRMFDTRRFTTATWYNNKSKKSLGELGTKMTTLPLPSSIKNRRFLGGTHLADGDVHYPAIRSFVNLENSTLNKRMENPNFSYLQFAALLGLEEIKVNNFKDNFEASSENETIKKMMERASNESEREMVLKLAGLSMSDLNSVEEKIVSKVKSLFGQDVPKGQIIKDRSMHELVFSWYENEGKNLDHKIKEAEEKQNYIQQTEYINAKSQLNSYGLDNVMLLERFPVISMAIGYTRKSFDRNKSVLNPFKQKIKGKDKTVIPVLKNENEAILFRLDPTRVLAWLQVNDFIDNKLFVPKSKAESHSYLYSQFIFSEVREEDISRLSPKDYLNNKKTLASIMVFRLLHTYLHVFLQSGKTLIGLDVDSLSEYLFPSALSGAIYVSKLQGGGMGALIAVFDNDLSKWLKCSYDKAHTCLFDPVCREHHGACHACQYLKFSCRHFNHGLSRNLLTGGIIKDYNEIIEVAGYFSKEVDDILSRWGKLIENTGVSNIT